MAYHKTSLNLSCESNAFQGLASTAENGHIRMS